MIETYDIKIQPQSVIQTTVSGQNLQLSGIVQDGGVIGDRNFVHDQQ